MIILSLKNIIGPCTYLQEISQITFLFYEIQ